MVGPGSGCAANQQGRFANVHPRLRNYVAAHPEDAEGQDWLGYALGKTGDARAALPPHDRALKLAPTTSAPTSTVVRPS